MSFSYRVFGGVLTLSLAVFCGSVRAQGRAGAGPGARAASMPVGTARVAPRPSIARVGVAPRTGTTVSRVRIVNGVIHVSRRHTGSIPPGLFAPMVQDTSGFSFDNVPGLGFDFPHLAAVHPNGLRQHHRASIGSFIPFFDGGFFFPTSPVVVDDEADGVMPDAQNELARTARRLKAERIPEQPEASAAAESRAEVPFDNTQYVFVRRDGSVFFAVAYSWENGKLRYITSQGSRGTLERDALDLDATRRFNEERGLSFPFPA